MKTVKNIIFLNCFWVSFHWVTKPLLCDTSGVAGTHKQ